MSDQTRDFELSWERDNLVKSDSDIVAGEGRITRQAALIERLRRDGRSTSDAEGLLETLRQTLQLWRDHREGILRRIAYLEGSGIDRS